MKHLKLALIVAALAALAVACTSTNSTLQLGNTNAADSTPTTATAAPPATADELAAARATYNAACVRCHRETGEGGAVDMGDGAMLKVPGFKSGRGLNNTDARYARQIARGGDGMPAFEKRLTPEQIDGLVRFIRSEFQSGSLKDGAPASSH